LPEDGRLPTIAISIEAANEDGTDCGCSKCSAVRPARAFTLFEPCARYTNCSMLSRLTYIL
jgi:hypothetical protein